MPRATVCGVTITFVTAFDCIHRSCNVAGQNEPPPAKVRDKCIYFWHYLVQEIVLV